MLNPQRQMQNGSFDCMIVEDSALIALALEDTFLHAGHRVAGPFATCVDAELWLDANRPDVAVVDSVLRDGPCHSLIQRLKEAGVPLVIFSGQALDISPSDTVRFMSKPASYESVLQIATTLAAAGARAA